MSKSQPNLSNAIPEIDLSLTTHDLVGIFEAMTQEIERSHATLTTGEVITVYCFFGVVRKSMHHDTPVRRLVDRLTLRIEEWLDAVDPGYRGQLEMIVRG